jgi:hypothetical protein
MNPRMTSDPVWGAQHLRAEFDRYEIELPAAVESAWQLFQNIVVPAEPDLDAAARAIAYGNSAKEIDALIDAEVTAAARRRAAIKGQQIAAERFIKSVRDHAQEIHDQLQPIADALIEDITEAARDGNVSLTQLVREGKTHEARMRADLDANIAKLTALQFLRDSFLWQVSNPVSAAGVDLRHFKKPVSLTADSPLSSDKSTAAHWYNTLVGHGAELHFWEPWRYVEAAEQYTAEQIRQEQQRQQEFLDLNRAIDAPAWR